MLKSLPQIESNGRQHLADKINVVCAADEAYVIPLAVTLRSMCENLRVGAYVSVFILDGGISESSWKGLEETLAGQPLDLKVINPDPSTFSDLKISHHISPTAYFRLLAAELLPDSIDKAIYLDSDLLVRDDISELWELPLEKQYCLAAVDIACPFIDARQACPNFRLASPYLAAFRPIANYRELGLDGSASYFNSGVMLMNLDRWRRDDVAESLLRCLRNNENHVWCWDQYALNAVFCGQWSAIEPRWNQGAHTFEYPSATYAPIDGQQWVTMKNDPAIVHFTTEFKPWHYKTDHPRGELFFQGLRQTAWRDWRPEKPEFTWRGLINPYVVSGMKRLTIASRKIASIWRED